MCSIYGAYGLICNKAMLGRIRERARDRGRDGGALQAYALPDGNIIHLGSWRATPTTEVEAAEPQPYGGIVHNGTIANDRELGNPAGAVDSMVLQHVLDRSSLDALADSLGQIKGSYALGIVGKDRLYLAANYKPIHYLVREGTLYFSSMERHLTDEMPWGARPQRLAPYSVLDCLTGQSVALKRAQSNRTLVIASGGLDSTTAAYLLRDQGQRVTLLHFSYGCQAEAPEAARVRQIAEAMGVPYTLLPIDYAQFTGASTLLNNGTIADGLAGAEFAHEWVPARNLLMIATAVAYAEANSYGQVALGNNLEEAGAYPDNEEEFTTLLDTALDYAVHDGGQVRLVAPVGQMMKHEIVRAGLRAGVPYELTWSCYRGGSVHCGACGPCLMRRLAFARNGVEDPVFAGRMVEV